MHSNGVPFFHAGQEIGLSKKMRDNTYNAGDEYNKFDYSVLDKRFNEYLYFKSIIKYRRYLSKLCLNACDPKEIQESKTFVNIEKGCLIIKRTIKENDKLNDYILVINPTNESLSLVLNDYYRLILGDGGYLKDSNIYVQNVVILPHRVDAFIKK